MGTWSVLMGMVLLSSSIGLACEMRTPQLFRKDMIAYKGRTLVATASWCSSCKEALEEASKHPEKYVFLAAFDELSDVERVLRKFKVQSPCFGGDEIVKALGIDVLPWTKDL